jgi:hypothetical protein
MQYTTLGKTGLRVSVAGLGCGGNSRLGLGAGKSEAEAITLVRAAIDLGINFIDTAEAYGTEEVLGRALDGIPRIAWFFPRRAGFSIKTGICFPPPPSSPISNAHCSGWLWSMSTCFTCMPFRPRTTTMH